MRRRVFLTAPYPLLLPFLGRSDRLPLSLIWPTLAASKPRTDGLMDSLPDCAPDLIISKELLYAAGRSVGRIELRAPRPRRVARSSVRLPEWVLPGR